MNMNVNVNVKVDREYYLNNDKRYCCSLHIPFLTQVHNLPHHVEISHCVCQSYFAENKIFQNILEDSIENQSPSKIDIPEHSRTYVDIPLVKSFVN